MNQRGNDASPTPIADALFMLPAFGLDATARSRALLDTLNEAFAHHVRCCSPYANYCTNLGYRLDQRFDRIEDIPYLPVHAFKAYGDKLRSVDQAAIRTVLQSSATSGIPSSILVDRITARRQVQALTNVLAASLGGTRRPFLICDVDPSAASAGVLGARAAAVRGFLNLARESYYALALTSDGKLAIDQKAIEAFRTNVVASNEPFVVFGFTYVLYIDVIEPLLGAAPAAPAPNGFVCHIGGWKKLEDQSVSRAAFAAGATRVFGVPARNVVDFYGFTEQMGVTYPSVSLDGARIAPVFADVIVRDPDTLQPMRDGEPGLLEFLTPLPFSYPGIAVLTDDYGFVSSRDGAAADGRQGTIFTVLGRAKSAEIRGCGDIMATKVVRRNAINLPSESLVPAVERLPRILFEGRIALPVHDALRSIDLEALPAKDIDAVCNSVLSAREKILQYTVDERISLIGAAARTWSNTDSPLAPLRTQGLSFLQSWCEPSRLQRLMDEGLRGRRGVLDGFLSTTTPGRYISAVPRGLCAHWLAGNVPLLGMLALVQCVAAGNANVLKAASTFSGALPALLESFRDIEIRSFGGRMLRGVDLAESIAVVYFPRDDKRSAEILSQRADVRIAWGGKDAVEAISDLPKRADCEDVIFGPKLSYSAIGCEQFESPSSLKRLARRVATDCSVFDQYGCANPHTIFVERNSPVSPEEFCAQLAREMERATVRIPKTPVDGGTAARIAATRLDYEFGNRGQIWRSKGTQWTVLFDPDATGLGDPIYSRVIHVRALDDILTAASLAHAGIQTIGLAIDPERRHQFVTKASRRGVIRFPEIGRMTEFDVAWDGIYLADRIVRWVVMGGPFN